jgi:hypothetical protein
VVGLSYAAPLNHAVVQMIVVVTTRVDPIFKDVVKRSNNKRKRESSTEFNKRSYLHLYRNLHAPISTVDKCNRRAHRVHGDG